MSSLTRRQRLTLITLSIESFVLSACTSVEAPFYPKLAMQKLCTMTEIGFVFSIFEIVIFMTSPLVGKCINKFGIKLTYVGGLYNCSIFVVLFGLLNYFEEHFVFLEISLLVRSMEGVCFAAINIAEYALIAQEFSQSVGTATAIFETASSLGTAFGSSIGGVLNEFGGYTLPFAVYGVLLFLVAIFASFVLPTDLNSNNASKIEYSLLKVMKIPSVLVTLIATLTTSIAYGFVQATLESFLQQFHLKPSTLGLIFVIPGTIYGITAMLIGRIYDQNVSPKIFVIVGTVFQILCFIILGPAPFLPIKPNLILVIVALIFHGFGLVIQYIGTFVDTFRSILDEGYENDLNTNGLICGIWTSASSLGAFVGPALGGFLIDEFGFNYACMYIVGSQAITGIILICHVYKNKIIQYVKLNEKKDNLICTYTLL